jgi:hypothetical protein
MISPMPYHPVRREFEAFSLRARPCAWCDKNYRGGRRVMGWWGTSTYCSRSCEMKAYRAPEADRGRVHPDVDV